MQGNEGILESIEDLRKKLNNKILSKDSLLDEEILSISEELDLLSVKYNSMTWK